MESLGVTLKRAREGRNLSISQAAEATRISARHLQSIEEERYGDLPGGMYNRAFIRLYAEFLGLNPKPLVDRYAAESATQPEKPPKIEVRMPSETREFRLHPVVIWMLMLALSVAGVYVSRDWIASIFAPFVPRSNPVQVASQPSRPPVSPPAPQKQPAPAPVTETAAPGETPSTGPVQEPAAAAPSISSPVPKPVAASPAAALPAAATQPAIILQVSADQVCWASFTVDGETVFARNLEPGERQVFRADSRIFLVLGNAGGVRATLNGKPAKPFGRPGEVIKALISEATLSEYLEAPTGQTP
jgi:cytoskeletal protein RodZ